ncbi:methylenetetrahydrofolate dehydrogenase (NADP+)/methenyltetrahydrofolate cyclohydrolase [Sporomusaceae bacterium BoRhaA]|uniref:bifunctional methylenetetrahydrofolate dehydrogenase/methenyltetrahydrofolate cyclohydrolase FolD n=1 Tax=Pelorhabdus rhamnosifermentans TaxID=2772457 RepID=UPI001C0628FB|nr:bifunctional methylenetetrahydrofolate dehydrogenase/methenyltetrahydrofolate cyclohydrolase FolD [Pelorhabdus rhamnosifermentans]MBU2699752.1 methylenetetrahydrofolate dehydrogenase (NADP+)/methenyltetrahydrofolate cyclohydrolase [Pelorhabdus rhamnosifermentans]
MARILDGKQIASELKENIALEIAKLKEQSIVPGLAVVLVGEDPASKVYVGHKEKACQALGIHSEVIRLAETITTQELLVQIKQLNQRSDIHGILVQLPLPQQLDEQRIIESVSPDKDVDGFHPINVGLLSLGRKTFVPCTPRGIMEMLKFSAIDVAGKHAVIIGRSNIVGKPLAALLLAQNATVTVCHSHTVNLAQVTKEADILIAAVGKGRFVTENMVKQGAIIIDVGINREGKKLVGDVDFDEVEQVASAITPVPGGVGPLTIMMLMANTIEAAKRRALCNKAK